MNRLGFYRRRLLLILLFLAGFFCFAEVLLNVHRHISFKNGGLVLRNIGQLLPDLSPHPYSRRVGLNSLRHFLLNLRLFFFMSARRIQGRFFS